MGWLSILLALFVFISTPNIAAFAAEVGIDYGLLGNNLPAPGYVIALLRRCGIKHIRIYDPNTQVLDALLPAAISAVVGVKNEDIISLATDPDAATNWVKTNAIPYASIPIRGFVVGNEVIPGNLSPSVVPAMRNLRAALDLANLGNIFITTAVSGAVLNNTYPPSQSTFSSGATSAMTTLIEFQNSLPPDRRGPLYVHVYPYFAYASNPSDTPLDYAMFNSTTVGVQDGNLTYYNMLDAMYDSFAWAVEKAGGEAVFEVGETGWPSAGNGGITTAELASTYNSNLYKHIMSGEGTPKMKGENGPKVAMVFTLFNENQKSEGVEQNWGLFYPNMTHVYSTPICTAA